MPTERLVLSYMGEPYFHRPSDDDPERPTCTPTRMRGVTAMRVRVEREGRTPCPVCWPPEG
ncbi:MAG TPA: hypothetical protein VLB67_10445 [Acidimicrobiia bacterium]|nr:hypothetical protein [Acidimicrobiia bacterium]